MGVRLRISPQSLSLLEAFLDHAMQWHHGYALSQCTAIASGTLYPILMRLEKLHWLETKWEDPQSSGRPPRHLYRLTPNGRAWAREELADARKRKVWKPAYSGAQS
jgi:PadR family transcriptional regulator PadR